MKINCCVSVKLGKEKLLLLLGSVHTTREHGPCFRAVWTGARKQSTLVDGLCWKRIVVQCQHGPSIRVLCLHYSCSRARRQPWTWASFWTPTGIKGPCLPATLLTSVNTVRQDGPCLRIVWTRPVDTSVENDAHVHDPLHGPRTPVVCADPYRYCFVHARLLAPTASSLTVTWRTRQQRDDRCLLRTSKSH